MYCMKCGSLVAQDAAFCGVCGQPVAVVAVVAATPMPMAASTAQTARAQEPPMVQAPPIQPPVTQAPPPPVMPAPPMQAAPVYVAMAPTPYAGFWLRFVAYLIDGALLGVVFGVMVLALVGIVGVGFMQNIAQGVNSNDPAAAAAMAFAIMMWVVLILVIAAAGWLYFAFMESSARQGTLGKMAMGLRVTDMQARQVSFGRASGRFFAKIITNLIPLWIGWIMAGFTEKKQALHDMIASCLVLRKA